LRNDAETCETLEKFRPAGGSELETAPVQTAPQPARKNISPGLSIIGKLGEKTKVIILDCLQKQVQPDEKYKEHLKLLWARGEVKWDGEVWYV